MKLILKISITILIAVALLVFIAKPDVPDVEGSPNIYAGISCLRDVSQKFDPAFFTYKSWLKVMYARFLDSFTYPLSGDLLDYYEKYSEVESDIECYIDNSNDPSLNMALSAAEFKAMYNEIAEDHFLAKIP